MVRKKIKPVSSIYNNNDFPIGKLLNYDEPNNSNILLEAREAAEAHRLVRKK